MKRYVPATVTRGCAVHAWAAVYPDQRIASFRGQYFAHHRIKRFTDVPETMLAALGLEADQLAVEAIGNVSGFVFYLDVF